MKITGRLLAPVPMSIREYRNICTFPGEYHPIHVLAQPWICVGYTLVELAEDVGAAPQGTQFWIHQSDLRLEISGIPLSSQRLEESTTVTDELGQKGGKRC